MSCKRLYISAEAGKADMGACMAVSWYDCIDRFAEAVGAVSQDVSAPGVARPQVTSPLKGTVSP